MSKTSSKQKYKDTEECIVKANTPKHTSPPQCIRMVVLTALQDNIAHNSDIGGLGSNELQVGASRYAMATPCEFSKDEYSFAKQGLELYKFTNQQRNGLNFIKKLSKTLPRKNPGEDVPSYLTHLMQFTQHEHIQLQQSIDYLSNIVKDWYEKTYSISVVVIPSRNIIPRVAGCDEEICVIPGNPMMHMDYFSFEDAYKSQCDVPQIKKWKEILDKHEILTSISQKESEKIELCSKHTVDDMIDLVNIWFPTGPVYDWTLAFLPHLEEKNYKKVQIISGSVAASIPLKKIPAEAKIVYKENIDWGDAFLFRSASCPEQGKRGILHGSIRISNDKHIRRSFECRFMIFKHPSNGGKRLKH